MVVLCPGFTASFFSFPLYCVLECLERRSQIKCIIIIIVIIIVIIVINHEKVNIKAPFFLKIHSDLKFYI